MSTSKNPRQSYNARETAFIIGYTDCCIRHNWNYEEKVAGELQMISQRTVTYHTILNKISRIFQKCGIVSVTAAKLIDQGTRCIDVALLPSDVRSELESLRREWGLSPLEVDSQLADRSGVGFSVGDPVQGDDNVNSSRAGTEPELPKHEDERSETVQIVETPEPHPSNITVLDGSLDGPAVKTFSSPVFDDIQDRFTSPECGSPLASPAGRAAGRKRNPTPEDRTDFEYEPQAKRPKLKITCRPADHAAGRNSKQKKTCAGTRGHAIRRAVPIPETRPPKASSHEKPLKKSSPIVIPDDESEQDNLVKRPIAAVDHKPNPEQLSFMGRHPGSSKRGADTSSEEGYITIEPSSERHGTGRLTLESVDHKVDACLSILRNLVTHLPDLPEETAEHIHQIIRTSKDSEGSMLEELITDLESQRALKVKYRDFVRKLVDFVDLSNGTVFPKTPQQSDVDGTWKAFQEHIVSIVGPNNIKPTLCPSSAGYMAASAENIAHSRIRGDQLAAYVGSLAKYFRSPQAQQLLFSALLCRWIFADPEVMLEEMHSGAMLGLYNGIISNAETNVDGLNKVQQYDQVATKLLLEDPAFQTTKIAQQKAEIQSMFSKMEKRLCRSSKIPSNMQPDRFAKEVIDFKIQLLMSPKEYRIHYVRPGTVFDASTMRAFDYTNEPIAEEQAAGKNILLCLFPALLCQDPDALTESSTIQDVLVKNKRFLTTFKDTLVIGESTQLSKAVVLISVPAAQGQ